MKIHTNPPAQRQFLTLREAADMLGGLSVRTIRRRIDAGELPRPVKLGAKLLLPADELQACMDKKREER